MKAGIVTIWGLNNYGNRLQNYAVTRTLQKMGIESDTLVVKQISKLKPQLEKENMIYEEFLEDEKEAAIKDPMIVRELRFKQFNEDNIPERHLDTVNYSSKLNDEYDCFITGSDQVWNPMFRSALGRMEDYLLAFAQPKKRVCFSPSIGLDELPEKWKPLFKTELDKYRQLAVREESGAKIITELTGKIPEVLIDPTLMLDRAEWTSVAKHLDGVNYNGGKYILHYFLGDKNDEISGEMRVALNREIENKGLIEHELLDKENPVLYTAGPGEFIDLIKNAALVCTDSFHATVFSILFGKPFLVCNRILVINGEEVNMSNRIITLLNKLGITERLPQNQQLDSDGIWSCDYSKCEEILDRERAKAEQFLKTSMPFDVDCLEVKENEI